MVGGFTFAGGPQNNRASPSQAKIAGSIPAWPYLDGGCLLGSSIGIYTPYTSLTGLEFDSPALRLPKPILYTSTAFNYIGSVSTYLHHYQ